MIENLTGQFLQEICQVWPTVIEKLQHYQDKEPVMNYYPISRLSLSCLILISFYISFASAQTTGKLAGRVVDNNGQPLIGANVVLTGTELGGATDMEGYYAILNVRAGIYSVRYHYLGYQAQIVENVRISADQTSKIDVRLSPETLEGEEIVVIAKKPLIEFNQTSSVATVGKADIEKLPVQNLDEIVELQAGVVDGHFRGGRIGEVQYQVDGVTVNNPYDNSSTLQLDRSVLEEVQVISGTFDAKYGQAMSGVVNAVLKTGTNKLEWSAEIFGGDYYPVDDNRYPDNDDFKPLSIQNQQFTLSGPALLPNTTFFVNGRHYLNDGYLFGQRLFLPTDESNFETREFNPTGDGEIVSMAANEEWSAQFKLTNRSISNLQLSYQATVNEIERQTYQQIFILNPDGMKTQNKFSLTHGLDLTQTLSDKMFYKISLRQNYFDYSDYVYEDVFDPGYLEAGGPKGDPNFGDGAYVQGVDLDRFEQKTNSGIVKVDFTWQANRSNLIESGIELQVSELSFGNPGYLRETMVDGVQILQPHLSLPGEPGVQTYHPRQLAAYIQDRVEWGDLVLRAGLRFGLFAARATIPGNLQNPANTIAGAPESHPQDTSVKYSIAPRLGFSFPLTATASIYFSYGHFYQMPGLGLLYDNADYSVLDELQEGGIDYGVLGNPDLSPEVTVQYEFGLKQALTSFLALDLSFFYKDIRDLLGTEFVTTYAAADYSRFTNADFGSVYGLTVALDQRQIGPLSTTLDYTMQFARGNSSDPRESANRAEAGKDSRPRDIPFDWDQAHTLNATVIVARANNYSVGTIIRIGSGQPYTPQIGSGFGAALETNSGRKPAYGLVDLRAEKFISAGPTNMSLFLRIFNLLNSNFANGFVFATTGSPNYSQFPYLDQATLRDPSRFYEPRRIEIGLSLRGK